MKPMKQSFNYKFFHKTQLLIKSFVLLLFLLILSNPVQQSAFAQWTHMQYLPVVLKPEEPNLPLQWQALGLPVTAACLDIDVAFDSSSRLYASTRDGIYHSYDRGETWDLIAPGFIRKLVSDPKNPQTLYAGPSMGAQSGIFKSNDGGDTWTGYNEGMTCNNLAALSISAVDPNILFTGSF